jgi:uncharacterized protein (UPF0333 family)
MKPAKQTVQQLILLGAILVLIIGVLTYRSIASHKSSTQSAATDSTNITTTFDQSALQDLQNRGTDYPDVAPAAGDQGKSNPFGQ